MRFNVPLKKRLLLLLFTFIVGFFILSVISGIVGYKWGDSTPAMRIVAVMQDLLIFILPAVATAVMVTRQPADLMGMRGKTPLLPLLIAASVLVAGIPAMNEVIWLNNNLPLPDDLYAAIKNMEDSAASMVQALQGPHDVPNLIVAVLIMGVLTGLAEELFFRGALQRIMITGGVNPHLAIWLAAAVFSIMHLQFLGFVPRLLLGAFFGYSFYWTRSIWVAVALHALNNTIYIVGQYVANGGTSTVDDIGSNNDFLFVGISVALVITGMMVMHRISKICASEEPNIDA